MWRVYVAGMHSKSYVAALWRVCPSHRVAGVFQIEGKAVVSGCHIRELIEHGAFDAGRLT
jgi:hypothetical protein